jgi:serine phosphatase RsbU (regulator of sigma subunit)
VVSSNPGEVAIADGVTSGEATRRRGQVAEQLLDILAAGPGGQQVELRILARLGPALGWDVAAYWRLDPVAEADTEPADADADADANTDTDTDTDTDAEDPLNCQAVWRSSAGAFDRFFAVTQAISLGRGIGLPGRVAASGQPAWIVDLDQDDNFPRSRTAVGEGLRSAFAFPVATEGRLLGVIEMFSRERRPPDDDLCRVMAAIGRQLGDFLARGDEAREREKLLVELQRTRRSREFLLRASRVLAEAAGVRETLERLAVVAVPTLADVCLIDMLVADGSLERVVARHASPELQTLVDQLRARFPPDPKGEHPSVLVMRAGKSMWSADMPEDFLRRTTRDEEHLALVTRLEFASYMSLPLIASGRPLGSVTLVSAGSGRHFGESDLALAEELAEQVAAVLDRARVYDIEHEVARTLQGSLLPDRLPDLPGLTAAARYLPSTAGADVGGDWYDVIPIAPGRVGLAVGDVVGHDLTAVTVMGQLRNALRAYALCEPDPAAVLRQLGQFTEKLALERLATVLYGVLELATGVLSIASAGHPPPLVIPWATTPWFVDVNPGPMLGSAALDHPVRRVVLAEGDLVVLYTDGLVEERASGIGAGMDRLLAVASHVPRDPERACQALMGPWVTVAARSDDVALLAVQCRDRVVPA